MWYRYSNTVPTCGQFYINPGYAQVQRQSIRSQSHQVLYSPVRQFEESFPLD